MATKFKNGRYKFKKTGTLYYARLSGTFVMVWKGAKPTYTAYCGSFEIERFLNEHEKV